jgi:hypothetical protein
VRPSVFVLLVTAATLASRPAIATPAYDPNRTATIYVHGFDLVGVDRHGVFGEPLDEPLADSVAALIGLPASHDSAGPLPIDVVTGPAYYGDLPPSYYSAADRAEIDALTREWGGGVPRYAFIAARYARRVLERSGAERVNFVSASFGSLIVRWLIEKNVCGLASEGRIARWLTIEGVVGGNWAASHPDVVGLLAIVQPDPIDVRHMDGAWIESHLHAPRSEADSPYYGNILIGQIGSTDDTGNDGLLRDAMLVAGDYQPNDGVQALPDTRFQTITAASRYAGRAPMFAPFHTDHLGLRDSRAAWSQGAVFLMGSRRVTVTLTSAQVSNLREPHQPWWDWRPAEVLFESRVYSEAAERRWGITDPIAAYVKEGAAIPLRRYRANGENQLFAWDLFDGLVLPEETTLRVELRGAEVDNDPRYGVYETLTTPSYDNLGGASVTVSTRTPGTYTFAAADWSGTLSVQVFDYAFPALVGVPAASPIASTSAAGGLAISPNPSRGSVRVALAAPALATPGERAVLEIADPSGRVVRRIAGDVAHGFVWDGRDGSGRGLPPGVYLHRLATRDGVRYGKSCLIR